MSRKFYNETVNWYNLEEKDTINWMEVAKRLTNSLTEDYVKTVPYQIKKIAVKDCYQSFIVNCKKTKKSGKGFKLSYRTRKDPKQSCYIPKSALKKNGIYHTIAGQLKMKELNLFENTFQDLRLLCEYGKWFIVVPICLGDTTLQVSDNQRNCDVVALDPGIRTFLTYFSENGHFGKLGVGSFKRILSLQTKIEHLISKKALTSDKRKKRNLYSTINRLRFKLHNLVDELHWKTINYLVRNYRVILLPSFETSNMVKRGKRKIRSSVVKTMNSYRFYEFSTRLAQKCKEYGVLLLRVNESYTSKTNSFNGEITNIGSRSSFRYDGITIDRDLNGARNILLRAMRDSSLCA